MARRRWGQFAFLEEIEAGQCEPEFSRGTPLKTVGLSRTGTMVAVLGVGRTWEDAFVQANQHPRLKEYVARISDDVEAERKEQ